MGILLLITGMDGEKMAQKRFGKYCPQDRDKIRKIIQKTSYDARLVVLGLHEPEKNQINSYAADIRDLTRPLPLTILVKGNQEINLFK